MEDNQASNCKSTEEFAYHQVLSPFRLALFKLQRRIPDPSNSIKVIMQYFRTLKMHISVPSVTRIRLWFFLMEPTQKSTPGVFGHAQHVVTKKDLWRDD